jgi:hypothetical protein
MVNQPSCIKDTVCTPDKTYESSPTPFADPKCICILGKTFQALPVYNPALPCTEVTQCKSRVFFSATLSSDNICSYVDVVFNADFNLVNTTNSSASFKDALKMAIVDLTNSDSYTQFVLNPGSIVATVQGANDTQIDQVRALAVSGQLLFTWNGLVFNGTSSTKGCQPGYFPSLNGACLPCAANTYVCSCWSVFFRLSCFAF